MTALRAWRRSFVPLTLLAVMVGVPVILSEFAGYRQPEVWAVAFQFAVPLAWLLGATVMTAAGLRAIRGEPVRLLQAVAEGLSSAGRVLSAHLVAYGWVIVGFIPYVAIEVALVDAMHLSPGTLLVTRAIGVALLVLAIVLGMLVFPLSAVVLAEPQLGPAPAVRRARALTAGRRGAIFLVLVVPVLMTAVNFVWTIPASDGPESVPVILCRRAALVLASGFLELLPAAAYVLLRKEKDESSLEEIFE